MVEKRLGALLVAAEFLRWLDVAGIVDEVCPGGASARLTHGQVIEAALLNDAGGAGPAAAGCFGRRPGVSARSPCPAGA
ncbi:hypothetical protein ACFU8W_35320 [Streptomyces sp. NPDC057565]|uniref:hypothetical protein n=1 Tax=Streptomyces sp. NPDC057565 TaxID=3346169 RepID=UPI0036AF2FE1